MKTHYSEINVRICWMYDGGIDLLLGDEVSGYVAEEAVRTMAEIIAWLQ